MSEPVIVCEHRWETLHRHVEQITRLMTDIYYSWLPLDRQRCETCGAERLIERWDLLHSLDAEKE